MPMNERRTSLRPARSDARASSACSLTAGGRSSARSIRIAEGTVWSASWPRLSAPTAASIASISTWDGPLWRCSKRSGCVRVGMGAESGWAESGWAESETLWRGEQQGSRSLDVEWFSIAIESWGFSAFAKVDRKAVTSRRVDSFGGQRGRHVGASRQKCARRLKVRPEKPIAGGQSYRSAALWRRRSKSPTIHFTQPQAL